MAIANNLPFDVIHLLLCAAGSNSWDDLRRLSQVSISFRYAFQRTHDSILRAVLERVAGDYADKALKLAVDDAKIRSERALRKAEWESSAAEESKPEPQSDSNDSKTKADLDGIVEEQKISLELIADAVKLHVCLTTFAKSLRIYFVILYLKEDHQDEWVQLQLADDNAFPDDWISAVYIWAVSGIQADSRKHFTENVCRILKFFDLVIGRIFALRYDELRYFIRDTVATEHSEVFKEIFNDYDFERETIYMERYYHTFEEVYLKGTDGWRFLGLGMGVWDNYEIKGDSEFEEQRLWTWDAVRKASPQAILEGNEHMMEQWRQRSAYEIIYRIWFDDVSKGYESEWQLDVFKAMVEEGDRLVLAEGALDGLSEYESDDSVSES